MRDKAKQNELPEFEATPKNQAQLEKDDNSIVNNIVVKGIVFSQIFFPYIYRNKGKNVKNETKI